MGSTDVPELLIQVPPRRFWVRVGSEILAEGTKFNSGYVAFHWPGYPGSAHRFYESLDEMTTDFDRFGWGKEARVEWVDAEPATGGGPVLDEDAGSTWHVAGELVDHGAAGCQGVGE